MVAVSTLVGLWIAPRWGTAPVDMIYLPAVLAAAALWGLGPALVAGIAAALAYNFFFTEPIHTFRMNRVTDVVTVVVLLIVALVTSRLAAGIRAQARLAAAHAARNATIAGFAGRLLSCSGETEIARSRMHRAAPPLRLQRDARERPSEPRDRRCSACRQSPHPERCCSRRPDASKTAIRRGGERPERSRPNGSFTP